MVNPTLTVDEILQDVIDAVKINVPGLNNMATNFKPDSLKLGKKHTAHVASIPAVTAYDANNGGYQANATDVRTLLTDVDVTVDQHPKVSLLANHLSAIADDKKEYGKVISGAGYAIAKGMVNHIVSKFTAANISQESVYTTGNSDYDAIEDIRSDMNLVGAEPMGRVGIVNTPVASALHLDNRVLSRDFRGEMDGANAYRVYRNLAGFESVYEWPELGSNNGPAVAITIAAATDLVTSGVAHGLNVGDRVVFPALTGGTGLTAVTVPYYVVLVPSTTTLKVSATQGGTPVNVTVDASDGTIRRAENLSGLFFDPRAICLLAGIPDDFDGAAKMFGAPATYSVTTMTDEATGLTMAAIAESTPGTLRGYLHLTMVYGVSVGRQSAAAAPGSLLDYAGHRLVTL